MFLLDRVGSNLSDLEDGNVAGADRVSVHSGESGRSKTTSQLEEAAKLPWLVKSIYEHINIPNTQN